MPVGVNSAKLRAMTTDQHRRLLQLLSQPTAPFRESHISRLILSWCERQHIPCFTDPVGNLVLGAASTRDYQRILRARTRDPLRLFIAHMDHPGFHGARWLTSGRLAVRWHGGSPLKHLRGARVRLVSDEGIVGTGSIASATPNKGGWAIDTAEIRLAPDFAQGQSCPRADALYGGFDFRAPAWEDKGLIYCPAADDLVGVFAIVETARRLWSTAARTERPFIGLLTRAEEVGFVGAVGHLQLGWLQQRRRPVVAISLEASRTLTGAAIGKGPVVRLGDRRTVFHPDGLRALSLAAEACLPGQHQRRIMDGGSCEATAMTAWGVPAIGISVPLGNYHNQGFEGGPDCRGANGPAPEFVSLDDVDGLLKLCSELMRTGLPWEDPWADQRRMLEKNRARYERLL